MDSRNIFYQHLVRYVRRRNICGGYGWPGKVVNAPAVTKYPNIIAEVEAYTGWLYLPAEFAGVSTEIMAAVVEDIIGGTVALLLMGIYKLAVEGFK